MILYYKLIGKIPTPCLNMMEWARWYEDSMPARIVAQTHIGPVEVSTIFLGLDHSFGDQKPRLFETMCFCGDVIVKLGERPRLLRDTLDYQERYESWDEAEKGHQRAIAWVQEYLAALDMRVSDADISESDQSLPGSGDGGTSLDQDPKPEGGDR